MTPTTRRSLAAVLAGAAGLVGVVALFAPLAADATAGRPRPQSAAPAPAGARAVTVPSSVTKTNWWFDDPNAPIAPITKPPPTPTGVPPGDLGVGYRSGPQPGTLPLPVDVPAGESDKQAFVAVDLSGVPAGASVTSFSVRVAVDTAGDPVSAVTLLNPGGAPALVACPALRMWDPGTGPSAFQSLPPTDCTRPVKGLFDPGTSTYTFSSAALAQGWIDDQNNGFAILADPASTAPFTLSLSGASAMRASLSVQPPASPAVAPPSVPVTRDAAPAVVPTAPAPPPGGADLPPVTDGTVTTPQQAAPAPVTAPQVAGGPAAVPEPVSPQPVALSTVTGAPTWLWVVGGIATAVLLAALSLSLGAAPPAPSSDRFRTALRGAVR